MIQTRAFRRLLPLLAFFAAPNILAAQSDKPKDPQTQSAPAENPDPPTTFKENVGVTATWVEQPGSVVPASVIVFTSDDIQRSAAQSVVEFLLEVAGFGQLHQSDSHVSNPSIRSASLRGLGGGA